MVKPTLIDGKVGCSSGSRRRNDDIQRLSVGLIGGGIVVDVAEPWAAAVADEDVEL